MKYLYCYDLEIYPNCFLCCVADLVKRKISVFEVSTRKDQRKEMFDYLREAYRNKGWFIGFNNVGFDSPLLHHFLKNQNLTPLQLFQHGDKIIKSGYTDNKWQYVLKDKDVILQQIDLFKINHFDNKAKATSLKMLEFNGRSENIQELPYAVGKYLTPEEIDNLVKYNIHDVKETMKFYEACKPQIEFRDKLSDEYGFNATNWNDTKIGAEYFVMELEKAGVQCYDCRGKPRQTKRAYIDLVECILPSIKFERPEFAAVLEWLKKQRITETKGVFSDILESDLGDVAKYAKLRVRREKLKSAPNESEKAEFKKLKPLCWFEEVELKAKLPKKDGGGFKKSHYLCWNTCDTLNVQINGFEYVFGTGGIHAAIENRVVESDEKRVIRSYDVSSYYPNLSIKNGFYPEHLDKKFCEIYEHIYNMRKTYDKKSAENAMLKLALNGTYGKSSDQFSPFYDPKFTMQITLNGQMLLAKAVEMVLTIPTVEILMCNTDGFEFIVDREYEHLTAQKCKEWEEMTNLILEDVTYSKMIVSDVNNYLSVTTKGDVKMKGKYEWKDLPAHKNQSCLIVKIAAEKYLLEGVDPEEFIRGHKDKFDFMLRTKVPRSSKLVLMNAEGVDIQVQNICRYYVSEKGGELVKVMPPLTPTKTEQIWVNNSLMDTVTISSKTDVSKYEKKGYVFDKFIETECPDRRLSIESGWKCKVTNDMKDFDWDIDYQYYIERVWKLVNFANDEDSDEMVVEPVEEV
jgi:hypothetical protein